MCSAAGMSGRKAFSLGRGQRAARLLVPSTGPWHRGASRLPHFIIPFLSVTEIRLGEIVLNQVGKISSSPARRKPFYLFFFPLAFFIVAAIGTEKNGA